MAIDPVEPQSEGVGTANGDQPFGCQRIEAKAPVKPPRLFHHAPGVGAQGPADQPGSAADARNELRIGPPDAERAVGPASADGGHGLGEWPGGRRRARRAPAPRHRQGHTDDQARRSRAHG